jgi:electron transfer flavoprotein alpha subunit
VSRKNHPVWILVERVRGKIPAVCFELIGHARKLADELGAPVEAVLLGNDVSDHVDDLFASGADTVHLGDAPEFSTYQSEVFSKTIVSLIREETPQILLIGSTFMGREDHILVQRIPAYGGIMSITCPEKKPQIATVAQGVFSKPDFDYERSGEIFQVIPPERIKLRVKTLETVFQEPEGVLLESAPLVVAGGAGAGDIEGWHEIEALAELLNAGLGSTRPAVDEGWIGLETMIGQSGKMVNPEFYIGIGLSGEQQHMVGISGAKVMVAINNDPKSPVFDQVDFGIVDDFREFLPIFIEKIREYQDS